jgi:hypothetical protein
VECLNPGVHVHLRSLTDNSGFWGWGTQTSDGAVVPAELQTVNGQPVQLDGNSNSTTLEMGVVVTPSLSTGHYTRFDISIVTGTMCNYHVMVTPST